MFTLTITETGTVDRKTAGYDTVSEAIAALIKFAGTSYRINGDVAGGTLTSASRPGGVHQAAYTFGIRQTS